MNNPVQIILNSKNFVNSVTPLAGGSNTDFFLGRDKEFVAHKEALDTSLSNILDIAKSKGEDIVFTNVVLQDKGWAKSHRPINKIFHPKNILSLYGGNNLGELIVGLTSDNIEDIRELIINAPEENEYHYVDGKLKPKVKPLRSEVGVIKDIHLYDESYKRKFSTTTAIDWLQKGETGHAYYIETFIDSDNSCNILENYLKKYIREIKTIYPKIEITEINEAWLNSKFLILKFTNENDLTDKDRHERLLKILGNCPIVRNIHLPPILQMVEISNESLTSKINFPIPIEAKDYPVVGIIDTGVSQNHLLAPWRAGGVDFLDPSSQNLSHGTFIGGLIAGAKYLNNDPLLNEHDCKFFDLDLYPTTGDFQDYFPRGFIDLLQQLDDFVQEAKSHGVRVFNMSLNLISPVVDNNYSVFANIIDNISRKNDVIFVISAGNLDSSQCRSPWPQDNKSVLKMLAEYPYQHMDRIFQPAESIQSISVGAIDPQASSSYLIPSQYTRRGPGCSFGQKPDVAHIGGAASTPNNLISLKPNGTLVQGCGTSYAAPLVAKTLANLDHAIKSSVTTETLKALLIHHAIKPEWSQSKDLKKVSKDFIGFGIPNNSTESLLTSDHALTMVFSSEISKNQELNFEFSWPKSLVTEKGGISGQIDITLVYSPEVNRLDGAEFILHTLDVWLRQQTSKINNNTGEYIFQNILTNEKASSQNEADRIKFGSKWWPTKKFSQSFQNKGTSSLFNLVVEPLSRAGVELSQPMPFTLIVTISDPKSTHDIFNEMRSQLQSTGVAIDDIRSDIQNRLRP